MRYIVFHSIRAGQKTIRTAKLAVTEVPAKTSSSAVMSALEAAGKAVEFSEAGIPWGNHEIKSDQALPKDAAGVEDAPEVTWEQLQSTREIRRITLRLPSQDYGHILTAAKRSGLSIQKWCEKTLAEAASGTEAGK